MYTFRKAVLCIAIMIICASCDREPHERWVGKWEIRSGSIGGYFGAGRIVFFRSDNTWEVRRETSEAAFGGLGALVLMEGTTKSTTLAHGKYFVNKDSFAIIYIAKKDQPFDGNISGTWWRSGKTLSIQNDKDDTSITLKLVYELED